MEPRGKTRTSKVTKTAETDADLAAALARYGLNDAGNSRRFTRRYVGRLIHTTGLGWLRWTGKVWARVEDAEVLREAKLIPKKMWDEVNTVDDDKTRAALASWAHSSAMKGRLEAMVKLASAGELNVREADLKVETAALDANRDILNTATGIVDLRTGELLDHEEHKDEYCTLITSVGYDEAASKKGWDAFLKRFWPDPEVRDALQLLAGAAATGYPTKAMVCLIGPDGDNGKTTLVEAIKTVLGTYGGTAMESTFTNATAREALYDLAKLRGVRFAAFSETREGHGLAAERIKRVTGGDRISARHPYGKPFEFTPAFLLWMPTNHPPRVPAGDRALWKRIWAVPCLESIASSEQVQDYANVLVRENGMGILRWIVEGASRFLEDGNGRLPKQPTAMQDYLAEWRDQNDVVKRWIDERTTADARHQEPFSSTFANFRDWCEDNAEDEALRTYTSQRFHKEMDSHYPRSEGKSKGGHQRLGMRLI